MRRKEPQHRLTVQLNVRLSPEMHGKLQAIAEREYRPVATELRRLIEAHIAQYESEMEEAA